jgi:hypothetical protein
MKIRTLISIIAVCFAIPMAVGVYDLLLQNRVLYDFMFLYIRMSPYTNAVQTPYYLTFSLAICATNFSPSTTFHHFFHKFVAKNVQKRE